MFNLVFHQSNFIIGRFYVTRGILIVLILDRPKFFKTAIESCFKFRYTLSAIASICRIFCTTYANHSICYYGFAINFVARSDILLKNRGAQHLLYGPHLFNRSIQCLPRCSPACLLYIHTLRFDVLRVCESLPHLLTLLFQLKCFRLQQLILVFLFIYELFELFDLFRRRQPTQLSHFLLQELPLLLLLIVHLIKAP